MKAAPENKTKALALIGIAAVAVAVAGYLIFRPSGQAPPDEETQAAAARSDQIRANMQTAPTPDIPVENRAGRGAVKPK